MISYCLFLQGTVITFTVAAKQQNIVLQINEATFLPNSIEKSQNLTKLLQNYKGAIFIQTHYKKGSYKAICSTIKLMIFRQ